MRRWMLFVEDDPDDRDLMVWALKKHGFDLEVEHSADGLEAQRRLSRLEGEDLPVLVITDLKLPKVNGLELLTWMRSRPELKDVPRVVITSSGAGHDEGACRGLGAVEYLQKPMALDGYEKIVEKLRRVLGGA